MTRDHTELTVKGDLGLYFDQNRPVLVFERDPNNTLFLVGELEEQLSDIASLSFKLKSSKLLSRSLEENKQDQRVLLIFWLR